MNVRPSLPAPDSATCDAGPSCRRDPSLLVEVDPVAAEARERLSEVVRESGGRLFSASERPSAFVIAGAPMDLAAMAAKLRGETLLASVREAIEAALIPGAGLEGFPRMTADLYKKTEVAKDVPVPAGTTLLVSREFSFDAAHNLPRYQGKCERLHGHTFKVRITVKAPLDTWSGIAFDFHDMKRPVETRILKILDHAYLNEIVPNPSAEYLAIWIWNQLADLPLHEIRVWETPSCFVTYQGPPSPR